MSGSKDGGPAFPRFEPDPWARPRVHGGMTLRDWFAGQALAGMLANYYAKSPPPHDEWAAEAYGVADAMLAERAK